MQKSVLGVIWDKHLDPCTHSTIRINVYPGRPPELLHVDLTEGKVVEVALHLLWGAGLGVTDSVILQHCLLQFGEASGELQQIVVGFTKWMTNYRPPWTAYHVLMFVRLIGLCNHPGVQLVGVGENLW